MFCHFSLPHSISISYIKNVSIIWKNISFLWSSRFNSPIPIAIIMPEKHFFIKGWTGYFFISDIPTIYIRSFNKALLKLFRSSTNVLAFLDQDYFQLSLNQQFMTFLWEVRLTRNWKFPWKKFKKKIWFHFYHPC